MAGLKKRHPLGWLLGVFWLYTSSVQATEVPEVVLTTGSYGVLERAISVSQGSHAEQRMANATAILLGTPYNNHTLNMDAFSTERLIIDLKAVDCMTFIEYSEAFKYADDAEQFASNLEKVRYVGAKVEFNQRRHFFSDWAQGDHKIVSDITAQLSPHTVFVNKQLNKNSNGDPIITTVKITPRVIGYIPTRFIDRKLLKQLKTGDYIGIYSPASGLDVTHVGVVIREGEKVIFRHASSQRKNLRVMDVELFSYLQGKSGIMVFR
ncbi:TPA: N-acetylmuramoyl-L-alanine amidase-like domain-containing protein [Providencia alcalifaciens]